MSALALALALVGFLPVQEGALSRIAFGSCYGTDDPDRIWTPILTSEPQLFLMIGDNVYADTEDLDEMRRTYDALFAVPGFQRLRETVPFLATWDDHDYGANDAGKEFPAKEGAKEVFLDFVDAPSEDPRRSRPGVYHAVVLGPEGRRVQVILLDTRWFRDALEWSVEAPRPEEGYLGRYEPTADTTKTLLGEAQWEWLAAELARPAELRLIVSSIQVVAEDHTYERWQNFPHERRRLLELVRDTRANGVVFLSGDRHVAEISRLDVGRAAPGSAVDVGYPIHDLTSSSLNRPFDWRNEVNRHRVGLSYPGANFGVVEIDWEREDPEVRLEVRSETGETALRLRTSLGELRSGR